MEARDHQALEHFARRVRRQFPQARIWAFGSRVRHDHQHDSDLDLCVVLNVRNDAIEQVIFDIAFETGYELDLVLTAVIFDDYQFTQGPCSESPLVRAIQREGIAA